MSTNELRTPQQLKEELLQVGHERYHHKHPFHLLMHEGKLTTGQLQAWTLNRYYYQSRIPIKDARILSRSTEADFRRAWLKRITDHDGMGERPGGIEKWIRLAEATGLDRELVTSEQGILPGVRYAVDAYLELVSDRTFLEAVASSLTELFSRDLISLRINALCEHYPWLEPGLMYFTARLSQAPEDAAFALDYVTRHALTRAQQDLAIAALRLQVRHSLGATGCDLLRLCGTCFAASRRVPGPGIVIDPNSRPVLKPGCRLSPAGDVLLIPEGVLRLAGPARAILEACDGTHTVPQIVDKLLETYNTGVAEKMAQDIEKFLSGLSEKGAIEFV